MNPQLILTGCTMQELAQEIANLLQTSTEVKTNQSELISIEEVCKLLHVNRTTVWKYTKCGKLNSYGIGDRVLYKRSEVIDAVKPLNV